MLVIDFCVLSLICVLSLPLTSSRSFGSRHFGLIFGGFLKGNSRIAMVAPLHSRPRPKISLIAPTVLAEGVGAIHFRCSSSCNSSFSVRLPYPGFFHSFYCKPQQFRTLASICVIRDLNLLPHVLFTANCHDKMLQIPNPFHPICSPVVSRELSLTSALMPCRYSLGTSW